MSGALAWFIKEVLIEFLWKKMISGFRQLRDWWVERGVRDEIVDGNKAQGDLCEAIAEEIKTLLKKEMELKIRGESLSADEKIKLEGLYEKLKTESRKLAYRADVG